MRNGVGDIAVELRVQCCRERLVERVPALWRRPVAGSDLVEPQFEELPGAERPCSPMDRVRGWHTSEAEVPRERGGLDRDVEPVAGPQRFELGSEHEASGRPA